MKSVTGTGKYRKNSQYVLFSRKFRLLGTPIYILFNEVVVNRFLFIIALAMLVLYGCNQMDMSSGNSILIVDLNVVARATGRQELM